MFSKKVLLKKWYITFAEKDKRLFWEKFFYAILWFLSLFYGFLVGIRNFFYGKNIIKSYNPDSSFLIGIGNISWSGTGKTPLALCLFWHFSPKFKTVILRRGYGDDEEKLIRQKCPSLFSSLNRKMLVKRLRKKYELFILDDSFQYRKLKKDLEIVIMGAREFRKKIRLIPASFFREPFGSIARADILIISHKEEADREKIKKILNRLPSQPELYFAAYRPQGLVDLKKRKYSVDFFKNKKVAALAAIGYPQGFFNLAENMGIHLKKKIIYPDHYILSDKEYFSLERLLIGLGIKNLIITEKDRYHLPEVKKRLDIFVLSVKLEIDEEDKMVEKIEKKIKSKLKSKINF